MNLHFPYSARLVWGDCTQQLPRGRANQGGRVKLSIMIVDLEGFFPLLTKLLNQGQRSQFNLVVILNWDDQESNLQKVNFHYYPLGK